MVLLKIFKFVFTVWQRIDNELSCTVNVRLNEKTGKYKSLKLKN